MTIHAKKSSEYFIAVAQKGIHSFMVLGVIDNEGIPKLLARVGKSNWVDPDDDNKPLLIMKMLGEGSLAVIQDEAVKRRATTEEEINYSAYSINYEQAKEFLALTAEIEKRHYEDEQIKAALTRLYGSVSTGLKNVAIECFVPTDEDSESDEVTFEFLRLSQCQFVTAVDKKASRLEEDGKQIQILNTCRTTAINMVEAILGFAANISKYFFIKPDYQTKFVGGNPVKETFYILPPPPNVYKEYLTPVQFKTLEKLYERLEELPKSFSDRPETRVKYDALKEIYTSIAGENRLSAEALLKKFDEHKGKKDVLFAARASNPSLWTTFFGSSTKRMFKEIKDDLEECKEEPEALENKDFQPN